MIRFLIKLKNIAEDKKFSLQSSYINLLLREVEDKGNLGSCLTSKNFQADRDSEQSKIY